MNPASPFARLNAFVLLGAMLLFGMEPLVGRLLLPSFGGSFHVWATCLMVFQGTMFLGSLYCHTFGARLGRRHMFVAAIALAFLPIGRGLWGAEPDPATPVLSILQLLATSVVVPFSVLATTSVMAQSWLANSPLPQRGDPYALFAASNLGSLLGLVGYPLLVEPLLGLETQRWIWSGAFLLYLALGVAASRVPRIASSPCADSQLPPNASPAPGASHVVCWLLLAAAPSACLMAVTNVIAMDLGSAPLVWAIPLALYLVTFILAFGPRPLEMPPLLRFWPEIVVVGLLLWSIQTHLTFSSAALHLLVLLLVCGIGHRELHRWRPAPQHLTSYYMAISLGGWLGGASVSLLAPRLFDSLAEYPISVLVLLLTMGVVRRHDLVRWSRLPLARLRIVVSGAAICLLGFAAARVQLARLEQMEVTERNYYGIYHVARGRHRTPNGSSVPIRYLTHGSTVHGKELLDEAMRGQPIGFYDPASPLGDVLQSSQHPLRLAIVGLGTGALAGHLVAGDIVTFYELDPLVEELARDHFHYLATSKAEIAVELGDARLRLHRVPDGSYDLVLIDAFSSDSIPTHLMTREALELYFAKLRPDGVLALHISSRYYDLRPVLLATGHSLDPPLSGAYQGNWTQEALAPFEDPSEVYVLTRNLSVIEMLERRGWRSDESADLPEVAPWTDDFAHLFASPWIGRRRE